MSSMIDHGDPVCVLHVDDDPEFAEVTATFLEREADGLTVETASGTDAGLSKLATGEFDCVVSDYDLGDCDGIAFLQAVRERHPDLPFVLFTGKGSEEIASEAISAGVTDYLQKGTGSEQYALLANRITNAVERARAEQSRRRHLQAIETAREGISVLDEEGKFVYVNEAYASLYGYEREDLLGEGWELLYPREDAREIHEEVLPEVEQRGRWRGETTGLRADGSTFVEDHTLSTTEHGEIVCTVSDASDRRKRKRAIEELYSTARTFVSAEAREDVAGICVDAIEDILGDSTSSVYLYDDEENALQLAAATEQSGDDSAEHSDGTCGCAPVPPGEEVVWEVFESGEPRSDGAVSTETARSEILAPLGSHGVIRIRSPRADAFDEVDVSLAETVATHAGTVLNRIDRERELKRREQRLREEQQFVRSIFDALPDPLYAFDTDGYPIRWNERFEAVSGYSAAELETLSVTEFVPDEEIEKIATNFRGILETRRPRTVETIVETSEGDRVPFELTGAPLEDADGNLRGVTGVGRDVTDHKEHERRLKSLNETAQELMAADETEEIAEVGVETARQILGLDANAIHLYDDEQSGLVPVAHTDAGEALVGEPPTFTEGEGIAWRVYREGETCALDDVREDPDAYDPGTPVRSELLIPVDEYGVLIAGAGEPAAFDQQDVVLGELLAGAIATALEQVERTKELRERTKELREREETLRRQNDHLEEFASVVSHDLRNPLTVAGGRLALAREECDSQHLDAVSRAHDRMNRLIDDLLALAREGKAVRELEAVDLVDSTESCWRNVATADATITVDVDGTIWADRGRLQQLLENLLRNAIEHGREDVTITVGELDGGFYVADDGPGIPTDEREEIFDAGYSTEADGTGFGLSIVKQVADAHGWEVRATESSTGGTRFEVTDVEFLEE